LTRSEKRSDPARPIGVFDSGIGGLTVLRAIHELLPAEDTIYLGDTARSPYGTKSPEAVTRYSFENVDFLLARGIKILVVACNTSSAVALSALRDQVPVPVLGVIEGGVKAALRATSNRKIGVIGTEATIHSGAYTRALKAIRPEVEVYSRACGLFVPLAEEGWVDNRVAELVVESYLKSLKESGIDTLILGCTHYPLLKKTIGAYMGKGVVLVDSAGETAREAKRLLADLSLCRRRRKGEASFFVTDVPDRFVKVGHRFLGEKVESAVRIER
jgi:glutamate racemase